MTLYTPSSIALCSEINAFRLRYCLPSTTPLECLSLPSPELRYVATQENAKQIPETNKSTPTPVSPQMGPPTGPPPTPPVGTPMGNPPATPPAAPNEATAWPPPASIFDGLNPEAHAAMNAYFRRYHELRQQAYVSAFRVVCDVRIHRKDGEMLRLEREYEASNAEYRKLVNSRAGIEAALAPYFQTLELTGFPITDPAELAKLRVAISHIDSTISNCEFQKVPRLGAQLGPDGGYPPDALIEGTTSRHLSEIRDALYEHYYPKIGGDGLQGLLTYVGELQNAKLKRSLYRTALVQAENRFREFHYMTVSFNGVIDVTVFGNSRHVDGRTNPVRLHAYHVWHVDQPGNQNYISGVKKIYDETNSEIQKAQDALKIQLSAAGVAPERMPLVMKRVRWLQGDPVETMHYCPRYAWWGPGDNSSLPKSISLP